MSVHRCGEIEGLSLTRPDSHNQSGTDWQSVLRRCARGARIVRTESLTRREVLAAALGAVTTAAVGGRLPAASAERWPVKIGCGTVSFRKRSLREALERIHRAGYKYVEPQATEPHGTFSVTAEGLKRLLGLSRSKWLGINYDTANVHHAGSDEVATLRAFVERVVHVHVKDTVGNQCVALGQGERTTWPCTKSICGRRPSRSDRGSRSTARLNVSPARWPTRPTDWSYRRTTIYWDADLQRELIFGRTIRKSRGAGQWSIPRHGYHSFVPVDLLSDWREELLEFTATGRLRIHFSAVPACDRRVCLMQDRIYRSDIAICAQAYHRPAMLSYCPAAKK